MSNHFVYNNVVKREHDWYIKGNIRTNEEYFYWFEVAVDKKFNIEKVYEIKTFEAVGHHIRSNFQKREEWYPLIKKMIQEDIKKERIRLLTGGIEHGIT